MRYFKHPSVYWTALLFTILFFCIPFIAEWITSDPTYAKYAGRDVTRIAQYVQSGFVYPFGKWLGSSWRSFIVFPYLFLVFGTLRFLFVRFKKFWKIAGISAIGLYVFLFLFPNTLMILENNKESISKGTVANGSISNAKRVQYRGINHSTYSYTCYLFGRTFAHSKVRNTILDAYQYCEQTCPEVDFVLGEIGSRHGGHFPPHRTHRNGKSVDFMTPLLKNGKPYQANHLFNLWGYRLEFDNKGSTGNVSIDYETMAKHLLALEKAAKENDLRIQKVIFDPVLRPYLLATPTGKKLKHLPFTKNRVIVRHDDHYHVDFD